MMMKSPYSFTGQIHKCIVISHGIPAQSDEHSLAPFRGQGRYEDILQLWLDKIGLKHNWCEPPLSHCCDLSSSVLALNRRLRVRQLLCCAHLFVEPGKWVSTLPECKLLCKHTLTPSSCGSQLCLNSIKNKVRTTDAAGAREATMGIQARGAGPELQELDDSKCL